VVVMGGGGWAYRRVGTFFLAKGPEPRAAGGSGWPFPSSPAAPVMGCSSHQHQATEQGRCMVGLRIELLSASTSLASIMLVGPHHAAVTYVEEAPKRASGSTSLSQQGMHGLQLGVGLSFCVLLSWWLSRPAAASGGWGVGACPCPAGRARPKPLRRSPPLEPRRRAGP
jgi:hypothetical protein